MNDFTIFYSWQSDRGNAVNRGFIEAALGKAIKLLKKDETYQVEPFLDRDTQGVPGAPHIVEAILSKIDSADVFVADVTIVTDENAKRSIPNPNVLIELGYAFKALGKTRVIMVFNRAYGDIRDLPFDLNHLRVIPYSLHPDELAAIAAAPGDQPSPKLERRNELAKSLENNLKAILEFHVRQKTVAENSAQIVKPWFERLAEALEQDQSVLAVRRLMKTKTEETCRAVNSIRRLAENRELTPPETADLMVKTDAACAELMEMTAYGCAYGKIDYAAIWAETIAQIARLVAPNRTIDNLRLYPALLCLYAGGVAAVAARNYANLAALMQVAKIRNERYNDGAEAPGYALVPYRVIDDRTTRALPDLSRIVAPISHHLRYSALPAPLAAVIPDERDLAEHLVRFEYLFALCFAVEYNRRKLGAGVPKGSYLWDRYFRDLHETRRLFIRHEIDYEIAAAGGAEWEPFKAGVFGVSWDKFLTIKAAADQNLSAQVKNIFPGQDV